MKQWLETREVLDFLAGAAAARKRTALATVVRVRGSAYRHEGAKLAVAEDGSTAGNVSGGCLEQDVREVALRVIKTGQAELRSYCSSTDEIAAWDLGVGCEGQVDVLVEPATVRPRVRQLLDGRERFAVCTVVPAKGERGEGRGSIVTPERVEGDLGSKDLDTRATAKARELIETGESGMHEIAGRSVESNLAEHVEMHEVVALDVAGSIEVARRAHINGVGAPDEHRPSGDGHHRQH